MIAERLPAIHRLPDPTKIGCSAKRQIVLDAKDKPCADCGQRFHSCVMDFDHVRGQKLFNLSQVYTRGVTEEMVYAEIGKCDVVCANCHRLRHWK